MKGGRVTSVLLSLIAVALLPACAGGGARPAVSGSSPEAVVRAYVAAFNAHDANAVGRRLAEDLRWLAIDGEQLREEARGRAAMVEWLQGYFQQFPDVRADMRYFSGGQRYVAVYECVSWSAAGAAKLQCAHGTYEVAEGQIQRVWYWPAQ
jgi:hypothetical protein